MLDDICFELKVEIIKRLPVKSLIRFRSVSKAWKSMIDSPQFIATHSIRHDHSPRLLVTYSDLHRTKKKYVCIVDDDTFPHQKFSPTIPSSVERFQSTKVFGSSHGLFCFSGHHRDCLRETAVLWNPSIRRSITISLPRFSYTDESVCGFGVCPVTSDPKILMTSNCLFCNSMEVKLFTLSSGVWRSLTINQPCQIDRMHCSPVVTNRFIYWLVYDKPDKPIAIDASGFHRYRRIVSFDLSNDEFGEVDLPDNLALLKSVGFVDFSIIKIRESLALIEHNASVNNRCFNVWRMEDGVSKSFIKVLTFYDVLFGRLLVNHVLGFGKTDEPILEVQNISNGVSGLAALAVYEPSSQHMVNPRIRGFGSSFSVFSYTETLLLINQRGYLDMDEDKDDV